MMSAPAITATHDVTALRGPTCPKCGGSMWDNRATKRNPKAPDFRCRDRSCDGVLWPSQASNGSAPQNGDASTRPGQGSIPTGTAGGPLATTVDGIVRDALRGCYLNVTRFVLTDVRPLYDDAGVPCSDATIAAIVATVFISVCKRGGPEVGHE